MQIALLLIGSYILGSIPFGLIIGKAWRGIDIREHGSGNIGATNALRALGPGPAAVVMALDVLKGLIPVLVAKQIAHDQDWIVVAAGMIAILGHSLSIFLRFKGGKGVATSLGVLIGLNPVVAGIGFGIWLIVLLLTRYVSVASIIACASIPIVMWKVDGHQAYIVFALLTAVFVIVKHRSNMVRLIQGREHRWGKKGK
jgi:glycerol-3-phosphate acyltransferase PlsY